MEINIIDMINKYFYYILLIKIILFIVIYLIFLTYIFNKVFLYFEHKFDIIKKKLNKKLKPPKSKKKMP